MQSVFPIQKRKITTSFVLAKNAVFSVFREWNVSQYRSCIRSINGCWSVPSIPQEQIRQKNQLFKRIIGMSTEQECQSMCHHKHRQYTSRIAGEQISWKSTPPYIIPERIRKYTNRTDPMLQVTRQFSPAANRRQPFRRQKNRRTSRSSAH